MSNTKFRVLIFVFFAFFILFNNKIFCKNTRLQFNSKIKQVKFSYKIAINNLKFVQTKANYENYFKPDILNNSILCYKKNKKFFIKAEKKYKVSKFVILSILTVESFCGKYKEKYLLPSVFKTLILLYKNPRIQEKTFLKLKKKFPDIKKQWFYKRVKKKYNWAKLQLNALKIIYTKHHIDIFKIKSSWAGAFGLCQFLPTTFLNFAVDGNNDKKIDLWSFPDSIFSVANYLKIHKWNENASEQYKKKVIFSYNHSNLYSDTIYRLSEIFRNKMEKRH